MARVLAVLLIVASLAVAIQLSQNAEVLDKFLDFIQKYNKNYSNEEFTTRFSNFQASLHRAEAKNSKATKGASYGITKFSDLSPEEFRSEILMHNKITPKPIPSNKVHRREVTAVPDYFDWRDQNAVTAVKNQEQCGSCWAFSVTENVESMWILAGKGTLDNTNFAPQQLVDCSDLDLGCNGGNPAMAYEYIIDAGGIESNSSYPYTGEDGNCAFDANDIVGKISSWGYATDWFDEKLLQANLLALGPLSICVDASAWQDYVSGVMTWDECAYIDQLDHCVQLVGYDSTNSSNPYWMVRNSWATDWGIDGYIWLQMWEDTCGLTLESSCSKI